MSVMPSNPPAASPLLGGAMETLTGSAAQHDIFHLSLWPESGIAGSQAQVKWSYRASAALSIGASLGLWAMVVLALRAIV